MLKIKESNYICIDDDLDAAVSKAKKLYFEGSVFVYPTDTIYGFGANPFNEEAIAKVNRIKGRPDEKHYIYLIDSIDTLSNYVEIKFEKHIDYLYSIWPNPVSVVLNLNSRTANILNITTAAFRIASERFCQRLTSEIRMPLISTSVNRTNQSPINHPEIIKNEFGSEVDCIFYSNKKYFDKASTLIDLTGTEPIILREGRIKFEELIKKYKQLGET